MKRLHGISERLLIGASVVIAGLFILFASYTPNSSLAAALITSKTPFGGRVIFTYDCDIQCGGGTFVVIGPPKGGNFMKTFGTDEREYKAIKSGNWTLGLAGSNKQCKKYIPQVGCIPLFTGKEIEIIGTSK